MVDMVAFILAGGQGQRLSVLTSHRAKPAVPFAGNYRIIDFTMTNCVRSGISHVYVLTQYISRSLVRHLGIGKPWDLDRRKGGLRLLHPRLGYKGADWYQGTADAIYQNISVLKDLECENILILSGDHVYRADYNKFLKVHNDCGVKCTIGVVDLKGQQTDQFGIATVDSGGLVRKFEEKPDRSKSSLASMGIYIFNRRFLIDTLERLKKIHHDLDFGKHVIPHLTEKGQIAAYRFDGYWLDIGTLDSYFRASMELLESDSGFDLYGDNRVLTVWDDSLPMFIDKEAEVDKSIICGGCVIKGKVSSSILSPGVEVEEGATVEDSVIFHGCRIERGAKIKNCIMDKRSAVGKGTSVGLGKKRIPNGLQPNYLHSGLTLIGRKTKIPEGINIGSNCLLIGKQPHGEIESRDYADGDYYFFEGGPA